MVNKVRENKIKENSYFFPKIETQLSWIWNSEDDKKVIQLIWNGGSNYYHMSSIGSIGYIDVNSVLMKIKI